MLETTNPTGVGAVQIFTGKDHYLEAGKAILDSACHLAVVQGLLTPDEAAAYILTPEDEKLASFNELVPQSAELDEYISNVWWPKNGVIGYDVFEHQLVFSGVVAGNSEPHTDMYEMPELGPLTTSLGLVGSATFYAEKPPAPFVDIDGNHQATALVEWTLKSSSLPRYSAQQKVGDLAIFSNYPWVSNHAARAPAKPRAKREAAIFNYRLQRTQPQY